MEHLKVAYLFIILFGVCRDSWIYVGAATTCGGHFNSSSGRLTSPGYPRDYEDSVQCEWIIEDPNKNRILLYFKEFVLEPNHDCLEIRNGDSALSPLIETYCGPRILANIVSPGYQIHLKFHTDNSVRHKGFNLEWGSATESYQVDGASEIHRQRFNSSSGVITSPNYPEQYPDDFEDEYIIEAPINHPVVLHVKKFNIESQTKCKSDHLEIRSGITFLVQNGSSLERSTLLGKYCGNNIPEKITSIDNRILLRFKTNGAISNEGFVIEWDSNTPGNCGGNLATNRGSISSPHYPELYSGVIQCNWNIQVSAGSVIQFILVDLEFETVDQCRYDFLEIFDGSDSGGEKLGKYCRTINHPLYVESTSNVASISFRSDSPISGRRFRIIYHSLCHNKLNGSKGVIESPNFPDNYPDGENCSWIIEAPMNRIVHLMFSTFDLDGGLEDSCDNDYLEITQETDDESNRMIGKFCNSKVPPPVIVSSQRRVFLKFYSDNSTSGKGFRLKWDVNVQNLVPPLSRSCLLWSQLVSKRDDYTYTAGVGRHKLHTQAATWNEARITCEEEGGYLVIINSIAELIVVTGLFNNSKTITGSQYPNLTSIGIHDFYSEGQFVTIHGESLNEVGFSQWADGQPDNNEGSEKCGALSISGELNDISCETQYAFICELPIY